MKLGLSPSWLLRLVTLAVWLVAVLCGTYWALKFVTVKPVSANPAAAAPAVVVDSTAVAKLLGATDSIAGQSIMATAGSTYSLFGLAATGAGTGVALIAMEGKPAKPYRVGSKVADDWVLKSVSSTEAILATAVDAPDGMKLELPKRMAADTASHPSVNAPLPLPSYPPAATPSLPSADSPAVSGVVSPQPDVTNPLTPAPAGGAVRRPLSRFAPAATSSAPVASPVPPTP